MAKYQSICTPEVSHNEANLLTELIFLNRNMQLSPFPWKTDREWGKMVAAINRLMKVHGLSADQIAFYIYKCAPIAIDPTEFAKLAVVAKKLFRKLDLQELVSVYREKFIASKAQSMDSVTHKVRTNPKSLMSFLKELENDE
jgi:hypothetical protein